ncbi:hypothetical protein ACFY2Q_02895 [Micromonospora sp. NPDC000316]|uniref:hypothetical protein n=1 Tax=Micromonospora sp. NPDC000316 TaxID=3364216 RepID=UPI0036AF30F6
MLAHIKGHPLIVTDDGSVITLNETNVAATLAVPIRIIDSSIDISDFDGQQVIATGVLQGLQLAIESPPGLTSRPVLEKTALSRRRSISARSRSSRSAATRRPAAEQTLIKHGTLLDAWTDERTGRRLALTTDVAAIKDALTPFYGNTLSVIESRWSRQYLDEIHTSIDEELLLSSGNTISPSNQLQAAMTLLHLPSRLARHLARFPADALHVKVLVKPLATI